MWCESTDTHIGISMVGEYISWSRRKIRECCCCSPSPPTPLATYSSTHTDAEKRSLLIRSPSEFSSGFCAMAGLPPPPDMGAGRGRGMTLPSWMTGSSFSPTPPSALLFQTLLSCFSVSASPFSKILSQICEDEKQKLETRTRTETKEQNHKTGNYVRYTLDNPLCKYDGTYLPRC